MHTKVRKSDDNVGSVTQDNYDMLWLQRSTDRSYKTPWQAIKYQMKLNADKCKNAGRKEIKLKRKKKSFANKTLDCKVPINHLEPRS